MSMLLHTFYMAQRKLHTRLKQYLNMSQHLCTLPGSRTPPHHPSQPPLSPASWRAESLRGALPRSFIRQTPGPASPCAVRHASLQRWCSEDGESKEEGPQLSRVEPPRAAKRAARRLDARIWKVIICRPRGMRLLRGPDGISTTGWERDGPLESSVVRRPAIKDAQRPGCGHLVI